MAVVQIKERHRAAEKNVTEVPELSFYIMSITVMHKVRLPYVHAPHQSMHGPW